MKKNWLKIIFGLLAVIALSFFIFGRPAPSLVQAQTSVNWKMMTWGLTNTAEWNTNFGFSGTRLGCSNTPDTCIANFLIWARDNPHINELIGGIVSNPEVFDGNDPPLPFPQTLTDYATEYSQKTIDKPIIKAIGYDDFMQSYRKWTLDYRVASAPDLLDQVINNFKSVNPNLKFKISLYEDELNSSFLNDPTNPNYITPATRAKFDIIFLYLHYRQNGLNYANYVQTAKTLFPNAQIVAGAYAYDRIDYIPCDDGSFNDNPPAPKCTLEEELSLFRQAFETQIQLLKAGTISAIEFYPAYFGNEEQIGMYNPPALPYCDPNRVDPTGQGRTGKDQCIANTQQMRRDALDIYNNYRPPPTPPTLLTIRKTVDKTGANPGEVLTYTLAYTVGGEDLSHIVMSDAIPEGTTLVAGSTGGGVYDPGQKQINWNFNNLAKQTSGRFVFQVKVNQ